jgi:hypothetical protein
VVAASKGLNWALKSPALTSDGDKGVNASESIINKSEVTLPDGKSGRKLDGITDSLIEPSVKGDDDNGDHHEPLDLVLFNICAWTAGGEKRDKARLEELLR